jgi:hypothetical protein
MVATLQIDLKLFPPSKLLPAQCLSLFHFENGEMKELVRTGWCPCCLCPARPSDGALALVVCAHTCMCILVCVGATGHPAMCPHVPLAACVAISVRPFCLSPPLRYCHPTHPPPHTQFESPLSNGGVDLRSQLGWIGEVLHEVTDTEFHERMTEAISGDQVEETVRPLIEAFLKKLDKIRQEQEHDNVCVCCEHSTLGPATPPPRHVLVSSCASAMVHPLVPFCPRRGLAWAVGVSA